MLQRMNLWTAFFKWFQFIGTTCLGLAALFFSYIDEDIVIKIILFLSGVFMLGYAIFNYRKISHNINILVETYPELDGELSNLSDADYLDEDLCLLVYGDHLFSYRFFELVDLNDCKRIYFRERRRKYGPYLVAKTRRGMQHLFQVRARNTADIVRQDCQALCEYIGELYPRIDIDV